MGIPNDYDSFLPLVFTSVRTRSRHLHFNENPAADPAHLHRNPPAFHHFPGLFLLFPRDPFQALKPLFRVRRHHAKRRRIIIPHPVTPGNSAGKRIFKHSAIQPENHMFHIPFHVFPCSRRRKRNSSRLRHSQRRLPIIFY